MPGADAGDEPARSDAGEGPRPADAGDEPTRAGGAPGPGAARPVPAGEWEERGADVAAGAAKPAAAVHRAGGRRLATALTTGWARLGRAALALVAIGGFVYLFLPIAVIVAFSFNRPNGRFNLVWQRFTLTNWAHAFARDDINRALGLSLRVALVASVVSAVLGTLMAIALARYRFRGGALVNLFLVLPLTTPEIVMGSSLALLFIDRGVPRGFWTIVIAHVMFCVSFVAITVKARIRGFDWTLEDAAMDLGAGPWRTFSRVTLPLILPGVVAAALLSFSLSIDDFIITFFVSGEGDTTFPKYVYGAFQRELAPQVNVLSTGLLVASVTALGLSVAQQRRRRG
jgi:spermidine/putrescine transport system permease protein